MLFHPRILARPCAECRQWLFDDEHRRVLRLGQPVARPPGSPTPCWKCPKQSPARSRSLERDLGKIGAAVDLYFRIRGTSGGCLSDAERGDPLVHRATAIIETLVRRAELEQTARMVCNLLTKRGGP